MKEKRSWCFYSFNFDKNSGLLVGSDEDTVRREAARLGAMVGDVVSTNEGVTLELRFLPNERPSSNSH